MTENNKKSPPTTHIKNIQQDLFSYFVSNDKSKVSNTVEFWEKIPKYFLSAHQIKSLRSEDGLAKPYTHEFFYEGELHSIVIQPALIKQNDGTFLACFPGVTEEIVEEALKKIFSNQNCGFHDPKNLESWVRFSQSMIYKELKARGRTRKRPDIKRSIEIMSRTNLTVYKGKKEIWTGSILQDLVTVDREKYLANTGSYHIARLPLFVSHAINHLEYRQFNYDRFMQCGSQLSRWIYKHMVHRYRQASVTNTYHFKFSDIKHDSGLLQQRTEKSNREKLEKSFDELKERSVILRYEIDVKKEANKIIDVTYTITPSVEFSSEQKAANKRSKEIRQKAAAFGLPVDNFKKVGAITGRK